MHLTTTTSNLPAATVANLAAWTAAAADALAGNTQRAYRSDSAAFADWCERAQIVSLPAAPETVVEFLKTQSASGLAVATVRRRASSIGRLHTAAGLANPCAHELVRLALKGIARTRGTDQRQAAPITQRDAITIAARLGNTTKDLRDLALLLVGRDLLARSAELVSLNVEDVEFDTDGAVINLRRAKTSTETVPYFVGQDAARALSAWLARAGITAGAVFQSLTKGGNATGRAIDTRDVRRILKAVAADCGIEGEISGHSLRVGMAQDLVAADLDLASVMVAGGWKSPTMVARYSARVSARRGAVARFYQR